ncbi:amino acid ABC transporter permease [Sphingomonas sp.]|uniref:amino acid ABC transporter permease n=1 Tax=Sphingomonas sp. TaxID=28214 RepID=UPI000DB88915|nr:amino acid ABC transporter permease [Sphingomonas sp.]PZU06436.1 MAG: amino acid ABC transporter permease [Sphingomonas sp.]
MTAPDPVTSEAQASDFAKLATGGLGPVAERPRYGTVMSGVIVAMAAIWLGWTASRNTAFGWPVVAEYLFSAEILQGLFVTLWMTAVVVILGFALGCGIAILGLSNNPVLRPIAAGYIWIFRSTPILVQLLFWYNIGYLIPNASVGFPFGPELFSIDTKNVVTANVAAILGLTFHEAAYAAEIVRGGILSIDRGQTEGGKALGLSSTVIFFHIVLPQAVRNMLPPAGNLIIGTLKGTSIVSVIAVSDLLYSAQLIYNRTYEIVPLLLVATIWYMVITTVLAAAQRYLERRFNTRRNEGVTMMVPGK